MLARLVRAYGGDPMMWLTIPACVVSAHLRMIPVLEAEEAQQHVAEAAVGASVEPGPWANDQLAVWRGAANRFVPQSVATAEQLAASGIGVRVKEHRRG